MPLIYLSLGSNLGDRVRNLSDAVGRLGAMVLRLSSLYETAPRDIEDQPWFLNQVAEGATDLLPEALLDRLQYVERAGGRDRASEISRGPRVIDLDILFYGNEVLKNERLIIPHPRLIERRFVLEPLLELNPALIHPETRKPLSGYLPAVKQQTIRGL